VARNLLFRKTMSLMTFSRRDRTREEIARTAARGRVEVRADRCQGCGLCIPVCPVGALALDEAPGAGRRSVVFLGGDCRADELCLYACPEPGALYVHRNERHAHA